MILTIDTEAATVLTNGGTLPLYSRDAYRLLADVWLKVAWNADHYANFSWRGRQVLQLPEDVLRLAEIVWRLRPTLIVETGVFEGGSAALFATLCERVVAVEADLRAGVREALERLGVTLIEGDSTARETLVQVRAQVHPEDRVLVFLDSDHSAEHVYRELCGYAPLVTPGSYIIVADTNMPELAQAPQGSGEWLTNSPRAAVERFRGEHPEFEGGAPEQLFGPGAQWISYFEHGWLRRRV